MYNYIIGKIVAQESNYIVVENNNIGYTVYVANPFSFELESEAKVYLYNQIREDEYSLDTLIGSPKISSKLIWLFLSKD